MKRLLAMLLSGCMLLQSLPGSAVVALGAETDSVITLADSGGTMADVSSGDTSAAETGPDTDLGIVEQISPDDTLTVPGGEDLSQTPSVDAGAAVNEGNTDVLAGDEIIDDVEVVTPVGEESIGNGTDELIENEESGSESGELPELELIADSEGVSMVSEPSPAQAVTQSYIEVKVVSGQLFIPKEGLKVRAGVSRLDDTEVSFSEWIIDSSGGTKVFEFPVDPGEYKVTVNASRYARYEQIVTVEASRRTKLCVSTARSAESDVTNGWLRLGDVVENEVIDKADTDAILTAIRANVTDPGAPANLNEGLEDVEKVDIADLQIAVQNKDKEGQESSVEMQQIPLPPEAEAGTKVDGDINNLISGTETVSLMPEEGKTISPETPVAISFPFVPEGTPDEELPRLGGMTIQAPVDLTPAEGGGEAQKTSAIASGWVEVEAVDETGKPVVYLVKMTEDTVMDKEIETVKTQPVMVSSAEQQADAAAVDEETADIVVIPDESVPQADAPVIVSEESADALNGTLSAISGDAGIPDSVNEEEALTIISEDMDVLEITNEEAVPDVIPDDTDVLEITNEEAVPDMIPGSTDALEITEGQAAEAAFESETADEEEVSLSSEAAPQPAEEPVPERIVLDKAAKIASDGSIVMDFGKQVAVKKVTIKITGTTKKEDNLVNISKVEFVNDMAGRIPEPQLSIPQLTLIPGNEEILVTWKEEANVTGYELEISGEVKKAGQQTQAVRVAGTKHTFTGINNNDLRNFKPYQIRARALNGEWHSDWSEMGTAIPEPDARPEPVDNLKVKSGYRSLSLSWKDMDDASGYMVFYREDSETEFKPAVAGSGSYQPKDDTEAEVNKSGEGRITTNSYTLTGLGDGQKYWVYVIGWNELGWGSYKEDRIVSETTDTKARPQLPKYKAINLSETDDESTVGVLTPHVLSANCSQYDANPNNNSEEKDKGKQPRMVGSKLDGCVAEEGDTTPKRTDTALGVVDNDYDSYWQKYDWDEGYVYGGYGIKVKLDEAYKMSYLTYSAYNIEKEFAGGYVERTRIYYRNTKKDGESAAEQEVLAYISRKYDGNGQMYYLVKFQEAIEADEIRMCLGRGYGDLWMRVGEMRFHECDEWYDGIMGLFADEMHSSLKPEVTEERLAELEAGLETTDHDEKHPLYDSLKLELELAKQLFADQQKEQTVLKVDTRLTTNSDSHLKFGGLNAWQPLGRVAAQGETMVIYVGHNTKRAEEPSNLQVVFTQYHAQSNELNSTINLKVGRNEITFPKFTNENRERGGQIYIQYTGARNSTDKYEVRALGGQKIPVLNIYKMEPGTEKTNAVKAYVKELDEYVKTIRATHESLLPSADAAADEAWKTNVNQPYADRNCLLNATDLMMDYMMYSVPALQVWNGITGGADISHTLTDAEVTAAAQKLETSLDAMEDTMKLFYQHKGLSDDPKAVSSEERGSNEMPVKHLNIRYMQMFAGAFMYASGNHIGVEYPETNVAGGAASWDSFGWGIAHEIGHDINQSWYAIAEITNNYFAQLLTKAYNGTRFQYEIDPNDEKAGDPANDIYSKVTSGALGRSANGAVQLGMYWQLHLAFDDYTVNNKGKNNTLNDTVKSYPYTDDRYVFDNYEDQFNNLFFARVDTYGRNPSKAPHGGVTLASGAGAVDQNLMRLSCAAANANILPFFRRWGMEPDAGTEAYAAEFGGETTKALYYVNDDARDYRASHPGEAGTILNQDVIGTAAASAEGSKVSIKVTPKAGVDSGVLLGYEIIRGMYSNGKLKEDVVGFKLAEGSGEATYIDEIATINNRVMYYKVRAVDQYLNYSNVADAGSVKIQTNGALAKSAWTIETTMTSDEDVAINPNPSFDSEPPVYNKEDDPDGGFDSDLRKVQSSAKKVEHSIDKIADGSTASAYTGKDGTNAGITIDMHDFCEVTSLIYRGDDLGAVTVSVSTDNVSWTDVKNIDMAKIAANEDGSKTIWFDSVSDDPEIRAAWIGTYEARYVKLAFSKAGAVKINEIDICGPTGDNLEFEQAAGGSQEAGQFVVGVLKEDYVYSKNDDRIPAGSLVFTGRYKGNPAYNVVILYDAEGNVIGAHTKEDGTVGVESQQVILAEVPAHGELGETSDGIWVYYLEPDVWKDEAALKETVKGGIRGELYRVDDANTNAGERIVSDTKFMELPETLPEITMTGGKIPESGVQQ